MLNQKCSLCENFLFYLPKRRHFHPLILPKLWTISLVSSDSAVSWNCSVTKPYLLKCTQLLVQCATCAVIQMAHSGGIFIKKDVIEPLCNLAFMYCTCLRIKVFFLNEKSFKAIFIFNYPPHLLATCVALYRFRNSGAALQQRAAHLISVMWGLLMSEVCF